MQPSGETRSVKPLPCGCPGGLLAHRRRADEANQLILGLEVLPIYRPGRLDPRPCTLPDAYGSRNQAGGDPARRLVVSDVLGRQLEPWDAAVAYFHDTLFSQN